jgi:hypothetical protein
MLGEVLATEHLELTMELVVSDADGFSPMQKLVGAYAAPAAFDLGERRLIEAHLSGH